MRPLLSACILAAVLGASYNANSVELKKTEGKNLESTIFYQFSPTSVCSVDGQMKECQTPSEEEDATFSFYYNEHFSLLDIAKDYYAVAKPAEVQKKIVINKSERKAQVYINDCLLKEYPISLGLNPQGDKVKAWDYKTPEGEFYVARKIIDSKFGDGPALAISYPNLEDAQRGLESGLINKVQYNGIKRAMDQCKVPPVTPLGFDVWLHGGGVGRDWTYGCIAFTNQDMDEIYQFAQAGCDADSTDPLTKIIINP